MIVDGIVQQVEGNRRAESKSSIGKKSEAAVLASLSAYSLTKYARLTT